MLLSAEHLGPKQALNAEKSGLTWPRLTKLCLLATCSATSWPPGIWTAQVLVKIFWQSAGPSPDTSKTSSAGPRRDWTGAARGPVASDEGAQAMGSGAAV